MNYRPRPRPATYRPLGATGYAALVVVLAVGVLLIASGTQPAAAYAPPGRALGGDRGGTDVHRHHDSGGGIMNNYRSRAHPTTLFTVVAVLSVIAAGLFLSLALTIGVVALASVVNTILPSTRRPLVRWMGIVVVFMFIVITIQVVLR